MRLPVKDSATWKGIITTLEAGVVIVALVVLDPNFKALVEKFLPNVAWIIPIGTGIASFIVNLLRKDVKNY